MILEFLVNSQKEEQTSVISEETLFNNTRDN
jgi:hypothetical protein